MLNKRTLFILLFTFILLEIGYGQTFQKIANPQEGGWAGINLEVVAPDKLLVAGLSPGNDGPFLQMFNTNGGLLWTKKVIGLQESYPVNGLSILADNSIVASIPFHDPQNNIDRQLVLKIAGSTNTIEWATQIGEVKSFFYGTRLTLGSDAGILAAHSSNDLQQNLSLTSLSPSGNINWSYTYGVSSNHFPRSNSLAITNNDQYLVSGWLFNILQESYDGILIWLGMDGKVLKSKTYQGIQLFSTDLYPNGDLLISGAYRSDNGSDKSEAFLAHTNSEGDINWAKKIKVEGFYSTCKALVTDDGGCIVYLKRISAVNEYGIIIKLDSQGNIQWQFKQHGRSDVSGRLPGVIVGNEGYANISLEGTPSRTVLIKTDLEGNVSNCPAIKTCLKMEDVSIDTVSVNWQRKVFINSSIPLSLDLIETEVEYVDYCDTPLPPIPDFLLSDTFCANTCTTIENLQQQNADAWLWSGTSIQSPNTQNPGEMCFPDTGLVELQQITFFGGCSDTFQTSTIVLPIPELDLNDDIIACNEQPVILDATTLGGISYEWEDQSSLAFREILHSGTYSVTVSNGLCTAEDSINVSFISDYFNNAAMALGNDTILCEENNFLFGPDGNLFDEFWWDDGYPQSPRTTNISGTYTFTALKEDCLFSASIVIEIQDCSEAIYLPNAFSPNADGTNDVFTAYGNHHRIESLKIFNQWGGLLYDAKGDNSWDGTFKGQPAQIGVYVYLLRYTDTRTGELKMISGDVVLTR